MGSDDVQVPLDAARIQAIFEASPCIAFYAPRVVEVDHAAGRLAVSVPMRPELERRAGSGQWHGGPIACMIDTVGDFAVGMMLGRGLPTVNFRVDYLRPATAASLKFVSTVRRLGATFGVADVDVLDENEVLVALGRATYSTK